MKKSLLAAAVALVALNSQAFADRFFKGVYIVTAATDCTNGPQIGDRDDAVFHPRDITGNDNYSSLNTFYQFGANGRTLPGASFTSSFQDTVSQGIGWSDYIPDQVTAIRVTSQTPASLTTSTASVILIGEIQNPWGETGLENCIVEFSFAGVRN